MGLRPGRHRPQWKPEATPHLPSKILYKVFHPVNEIPTLGKLSDLMDTSVVSEVEILFCDTGVEIDQKTFFKKPSLVNEIYKVG